MSDSINSSEIR